MSGFPRPLAVAVVGTIGGSDRARLDRRLAVALRANEEGYALLEMFEVNGTREGDDVACRALELLAGRYDIQALICAGPVDRGRLAELAATLRLVVIAS